MLRILATNASWSLLNHLLSRGSFMVAAVILARALEPGEFALYSYFQLTVSMLAAYAAMGLGVTASRFFAELGHQGPKQDEAPIGTLWFLSLIAALMAAFVMLVLPDHVVKAGLDIPRSFMVIGVLLLVLNVVPGGAILGLERYRIATLISALSGMTAILGAYVAASKGEPSLAILGMIGAFLVQALGHTAIVIWLIGSGHLISTLRLDRRNITRVFSMAAPMLMVTLMAASGTWILGRIILAQPDGEHAFAYYSIGLQWFALALLLPGMLARVALPILVRSAATMEHQKALLVARQTALLAMATGISMAIFATLFGPWLISIYGENYSAGRWFISAFMLAGVILAPVNVMGNAIIAYDGQWQWLIVTVVWFVSLGAIGIFTNGLGYWTGAISLTGAALVMALSAGLFAKSRRLI
jgi:O-antigen/teichoic acid export membrane protein